MNLRHENANCSIAIMWIGYWPIRNQNSHQKEIPSFGRWLPSNCGCSAMEFETRSVPLETVLGVRMSPQVKTSEEFRFGIEEEYFLADLQSYDIADSPCDALFEAARQRVGACVNREFLQPQLEVATPPQLRAADARDELLRLRCGVAEAAAEYGAAIMACGTHPSAQWRNVRQTPKKRYGEVMNGLQMIGARNMLCGMHVHVEFPNPDRRIDVMSRILPYIPLFLALSTSSPFWQGRPTGLKAYRLAAYDELPRTGLPDLFKTTGEYEAYVDALVKSGVCEDSSYIWWSIRPSLKYPTLELRAPDCCTRVDDAVAIASLFRVLAHHLYFHPDHNAAIDAVSRAISAENKWRAQRYGAQGSFVTQAGAISVAALLEQVIECTLEDAAALGCEKEVLHCHRIVERGTSADEQLRVWDQFQGEAKPERALRHVGRWIAETTLAA
jgi:carboxylate-amine ligase